MEDIFIRATRGDDEYIELHVTGAASVSHSGGQYVLLTQDRLAKLRNMLEELQEFMDARPSDHRTWGV